MTENEIVRRACCPGPPSALQVFRALVVGGTNGLTPSRHHGGRGVPAATLSFHLKELTNAGWSARSAMAAN